MDKLHGTVTGNKTAQAPLWRYIIFIFLLLIITNADINLSAMYWALFSIYITSNDWSVIGNRCSKV